MKQRVLFLIRHGQPEGAGGERRYIGRTELPLSNEGRHQAAAVGRWISERISDNGAAPALYSSPLTRAWDTAGVIRNTAGTRPAVADPAFQEIDLGNWEGKTFAWVREHLPEAFEERGKHLWRYRTSGGETFQECGMRFANGAEAAVNRSGSPVLIVSHSGAIRSGLSFLTDTAPEDCLKLNIAYADILGVDLSSGTFGIQKLTQPDRREIERLYNKYQVPEPVIRHMEAVAVICNSITEKLPELFPSGCREDLHTAALLHDIKRTEGGDHPALSAALLRREGYFCQALMVADHHNGSFDPSAALDLSDILFYADKRVLGDRIVSLRERFAQSLEKCKTEDARRSHTMQEARAQWVEMKLLNLSGG